MHYVIRCKHDCVYTHVYIRSKLKYCPFYDIYCFPNVSKKVFFCKNWTIQLQQPGLLMFLQSNMYMIFKWMQRKVQTNLGPIYNEITNKVLPWQQYIKCVWFCIIKHRHIKLLTSHKIFIPHFDLFKINTFYVYMWRRK